MSDSRWRRRHWMVLGALLILLTGVSGCGDDDEDDGRERPDGGMDVVDVSDTGDVSPEDGSDLGGPPKDVGELNLTGFQFTENPNNTLSTFVEFSTDVPASVTIDADSGDHQFSLTYDEPSREHRLLVIGFRPERDYELTFEVEAEDGARAVREETFESGALPEDFPTLEVTTSEPDRMQPGVTVFNVYRWNPELDNSLGYIVAVDETGAPVWYYRTDRRIQEVTLSDAGTFLVNWGFGEIMEIDLSGEVLERWTAEELGVDAFHHGVNELPNGNLTTLSAELREIDGYTDASGNPVTHHVVGDVALEFTRSGEVVHEHSVFEVLDPLRKGRGGFDSSTWDATYAEEAPNGTKDWTHGNAIVFDETDDSFILSLRHQDWIIKIDRQTGELIWRLGDGGDFELESGSWFYHQHAPMLVNDGNILLYDNGNYRPSRQPGEYFSRAVEYSIDTEANRARQVWEYRAGEEYYAPFLSDADQLDNGNVLVVDGGAVSDQTLELGDPNNQKFARIVEVTHEEDPEEVFEMFVRDEEVGYSVYRADRYDLLGAVQRR